MHMPELRKLHLTRKDFVRARISKTCNSVSTLLKTKSKSINTLTQVLKLKLNHIDNSIDYAPQIAPAELFKCFIENAIKKHNIKLIITFAKQKIPRIAVTQQALNSAFVSKRFN